MEACAGKVLLGHGSGETQNRDISICGTAEYDAAGGTRRRIENGIWFDIILLPSETDFSVICAQKEKSVGIRRKQGCGPQRSCQYLAAEMNVKVGERRYIYSARDNVCFI